MGHLESYIACFSMKTYIVGIHWNCLIETIPMSTHNICVDEDVVIIFRFFVW